MSDDELSPATEALLEELDEQLEDLERWLGKAVAARKRYDWHGVEATLILVRRACPHAEWNAAFLGRGKEI